MKTLVENGVAGNHRSFFVIVGDRGREQVCERDTFRIMIESFRNPSASLAS